MGRAQIGAAWGFSDLSGGLTIPLPARTISPGSLVVAGFRTEADDITLSVSDTSGGTWTIESFFNVNTKVFFAYSWNHPGGTGVVITATLSTVQTYRFGSAAEFEGGDATDPYISALTLKEIDGSASLSTPVNVDTFQVFGCYSNSTVTPVSPAFSLNGEALNTVYGFSAINTIDGTTRDHNTSGGAGLIAAITTVFARPGPADTEAPTLTSATATATGATTATGGVTTDEAGPAWAVLTTSSTTPSAAQIKAGQNHTGAAASASATATLSVGANSGVFSFTGLTGGGTYWPHVVQDDTATPANTSTPITSASSITTPTPDTTPPTMNGSITVGTKTSGSISISYPAASDNVAVTGYEVSSNGGSSWSNNGTSLSYTFLGLAALTSYNLRVRAYDAAGNRATTPLAATTSTYRAGDTAANILANTGPIGAGQPGFLYAFASTVTSTDWLSYTIVSGPTPSGGTLDAQPDGRFTYTGPAPATMVIQPEVNGVNAAETITVTLYDAAPDTELPVLTGSITVTSITSTGYNLSWPTGTDNTGVTGYEYSLNGGSSWTDNGNVTTKAITGRTPESTDQVRVRAYDAAGNKSTPALATSVTLLAAPDVTAPTLTLPTAYASGPTTASGTVTTNEATGTLYFLRNTSATATAAAVKAGLSQPVTASGIQTVNVTGLTASTSGNRIHYLHRDAAGNDSLVSSSDAFATPAAPAPGLKVIGAQPTKLIARPITRPIVIGQTD